VTCLSQGYGLGERLSA